MMDALYDRKICVVGLGYVGLPLAVEFGKRMSVTGFDIDKGRIDELVSGFDRSGEVTSDELASSCISLSSDSRSIRGNDFIVIAVPTPIDQNNKPDLVPLISASKLVGENLSYGDIVVYESTVYPGVTEDICIPILEDESGLFCGKDFKVGYSPERITPGGNSRLKAPST